MISLPFPLKRCRGSLPNWGCKKYNLDLFFLPNINFIALSPGIKKVITVHDLSFERFPYFFSLKRRLWHFFINPKKLIKNCDKIIAISENTKKDLIEKFKIEPEKQAEIVVVPCAAGEDFCLIGGKDAGSPADQRYELGGGLPSKFFLSTGTIEPRKNYETLIQAFAMFHKNHPDYHLIIVGKKGWDKEYIEDLEELVTSNYLQKYVHILGYITNKSLNKLYNQATAFIFPSYYEGFGIPPLEAINCGCPVISSYTSSMPEVLGEAAAFCDPSRPSEFAKAMEKITCDNGFKNELINKGRLQSKKFSWTSSAEKLKSSCIEGIVRIK